MVGRLVRTALRSALNQVKYVTPVSPRHATDLTAEVYGQVERDFGMLAPPVCLHSPAPATMAAVWAMLRESLVVTTSVSRATKEAVAAGVSVGNTCPYCVEVHAATLGGLGGDAGALAVREPDRITDPELREIATWARDSATAAGTAGRRWPFPVAHAPQLIGVAVTFHYLNRVVNVFLDDSPLPPNVPSGARGTARRFLGRFMRGAARRQRAPGESVELLAPATPAIDLAWTEGEPHVADAFGRAAATIDAAAAASVPPSVRDLVTTELSDWDGEPPGLSRAWLDRAVRTLPAGDRPAGRLALLVAKSSYQVDPETVADHRAADPRDSALVELVSWAAFAAARRAGSRLAGQEPGRAASSAA
jgi:AhpD family alkylhydroperoxidase